MGRKKSNAKKTHWKDVFHEVMDFRLEGEGIWTQSCSSNIPKKEFQSLTESFVSTSIHQTFSEKNHNQAILSTDLLSTICEFIPSYDLPFFMVSCKQFYSAASADRVWKVKFFENFGEAISLTSKERAEWESNNRYFIEDVENSQSKA